MWPLRLIDNAEATSLRANQASHGLAEVQVRCSRVEEEGSRPGRIHVAEKQTPPKRGFHFTTHAGNAAVGRCLLRTLAWQTD